MNLRLVASHGISSAIFALKLVRPVGGIRVFERARSSLWCTVRDEREAG